MNALGQSKSMPSNFEESKNALFQCAYNLSTKEKCDVCVLVFKNDKNGDPQVYRYGSTTADLLLLKYANHEGNEVFENHSNITWKGKMKLEDEQIKDDIETISLNSDEELGARKSSDNVKQETFMQSKGNGLKKNAMKRKRMKKIPKDDVTDIPKKRGRRPVSYVHRGEKETSQNGSDYNFSDENNGASAGNV